MLVTKTRQAVGHTQEKYLWIFREGGKVSSLHWQGLPSQLTRRKGPWFFHPQILASVFLSSFWGSESWVEEACRFWQWLVAAFLNCPVGETTILMQINHISSQMLFPLLFPLSTRMGNLNTVLLPPSSILSVTALCMKRWLFVSFHHPVQVLGAWAMCV